jgi:hypothetical protein
MRLAEWFRRQPPSGDGDDALIALSDVGLVRRLLDHAEFEAVRIARRNGRSWSEIAVRLGVTRQSAWEKWRDVDTAATIATASRSLTIAAEREAAANAQRRRSNITVPNVIGLSWEDARIKLAECGLVGVGPDPTFDPLEWSHSVVTDQTPESGATVLPGAAVTLWLDRGGGGGVREPRRPKPGPRTGRIVPDEAVS